MWASWIVLSLWGGVDAEAGEARRLKRQAITLRDACHEGEIDRCMDLADMTRFGQGMAADKGGAAALYRQGCSEDRTRGCVGVSELILAGEVEGDVEEATELLRLRCAQWDGSHDVLLAMPYLEAQAVTTACIDRAHIYRENGKASRAVQLYRKACAWDSLGCFSAAAMQSQDKEALALTLTARACGLEKVSVAPTQVVSRVEMERACFELRNVGALPEDLGLVPSFDRTTDAREGDKIASVDFDQDVQIKKPGVLKVDKEAAMGPAVEGICRVHLVIDEKGKPYDVRVSSCPDAAEGWVEAAGYRWRFEPVVVDGEPTSAQFDFDMDVKFGSEKLSTVSTEEPAEEESVETATDDGSGASQGSAKPEEAEEAEEAEEESSKE
jgi:hypothetical protein